MASLTSTVARLPSAVLRVGQLEYDVVHGRFNLHGQGLQLTAQEHKILAFFMHHPGKLLTRSEISENVYARDLDADSNTLDVLIGRIRRTLGGAAQLVTERGQGFRLLTSDEASSDAAVPAADVQWQVQAMAQVIDRYQARTFSDALHMQAAMHPATAAQPVDIAQCVGEVVRMMERLHADQALEWTLQVQDGTTPLWRGERTDLEEALGNLLDNAGKWAASAVRIGLAVEEGDATQPPQVVLQIEDDGPGMAPHQLQAAGQRGLRFDDSVQGSGLGLHIATQMVQAYGGDLSLGKSALLKGLSVRVVLPGVQAAQRTRKA
ncbi:winged helix-turn-helix domain-containing protein [uncultured Acidovorax sp.]|uniref:winged helix-turn-helix domain-containing protein n=1 Tax=uncultured Acidovorax sp. TaxID=158751 RepID=UPI0025839629|nr:winged helix-turn-helix domain-containing protein [uncultured Acidovorax sp.]